MQRGQGISIVEETLHTDNRNHGSKGTGADESKRITAAQHGSKSGGK